ncbi:hypothetical protein [Pseudofrankia inefficax]|nr:hypothetical protein [Pseudofrankia inefficax]
MSPSPFLGDLMTISLLAADPSRRPPTDGTFGTPPAVAPYAPGPGPALR